MIGVSSSDIRLIDSVYVEGIGAENLYNKNKIKSCYKDRVIVFSYWFLTKNRKKEIMLIQ